MLSQTPCWTVSWFHCRRCKNHV